MKELKIRKVQGEYREYYKNDKNANYPYSALRAYVEIAVSIATPYE